MAGLDKLRTLVRGCSFAQALQLYRAIDEAPDRDVLQRDLGLADRFFLLTVLMGRADAMHPWIYARCREVETDPDGHLDLWARGHYKSTVVTFAGAIQVILNNPEITIGIFSHTRPIAKAFLKQIKREFETNETLKRLYPDILWEAPQKQAPQWSEDGGLIVKRQGNPKEGTVEAWGLVDGQPTSKHYKLRIYDDVVTRESVTTPEQVAKTTEALDLSQNLGSKGGREWYIGTRYHFGDTYNTLIQRGSIKLRVYPATHDGTMGGDPVFLSREEWEKLRTNSSDYVIACLASGTRILKADWSQAPIESIRAGDEIIGVFPGSGGQKGTRVALGTTRVLAVGQRMAEVVRYTFENGKQIIATPDHQWWTGRPLTTNDGHRKYSPLAIGPAKNNHVCRVVDPDAGLNLTPEQRLAAAWLGGLYDGEGSTSGRKGHAYIHITQCPKHNPEICQRVRDVLMLLGFDWEEYVRKDGKSASVFRFRGGRKEGFRFLQMCNPVKRARIANALSGSRIGYQGPDGRDRVVSIEPLGKRRVHSLTTETGNYIAEGCVSKNCQQLQNPTAGTTAMFDRAWLRYFEVRPETVNVYILVDPASSKKKGADSTAMAVIAIDATRNKYLLDGFRHKMNLAERWSNLRNLWRRWKNMPGVQHVAVGYERYGMQSDLEHFESQMQIEGVSFPIAELNWPREGGDSKQDRIQRLVPDFKQGKFWLPARNKQPSKQQTEYLEQGRTHLVAVDIRRKDHESRPYSLIDAFIEEFGVFPFATHEDLLDAVSRLYDMDYAPPVIIRDEYLEPEYV